MILFLVWIIGLLLVLEVVRDSSFAAIVGRFEKVFKLGFFIARTIVWAVQKWLVEPISVRELVIARLRNRLQTTGIA